MLPKERPVLVCVTQPSALAAEINEKLASADAGCSLTAV